MAGAQLGADTIFRVFEEIFCTIGRVVEEAVTGFPPPPFLVGTSSSSFFFFHGKRSGW